MHMADALLSPAVGGTFWAGSIGAIAYASRKLRENLDDRLIPLMGVLGAFIFAGQMINFTIPGTGSSGHIGGGMLLAVLLGPYAAFIVIASVLTIQALFFADGGLLALGANIWNMGIYPAFIAYPLIYKAIVKKNASNKVITIASVLSVVIGLQLGALSVVLETKLSGITELPFGTFLLLMQPIHLAIGLIEGFVTAGIVIYVRSLRPDIVDDLEGVKALSTGGSLKKVIIVLGILAVLTGGVFSWFASTYPDGLEWSIEKIYGKSGVPERQNPISGTLTEIQKKIALLPDYSLPATGKEEEKPSWPAVDTITSLSGILGGIMVLVVVVIFGIGMRVLRKKMRKT
ncbi:MAG: energy-coupling factor ABC transporter permease [Nitrospirota bacterium]|nr:energy-coupling factor ABC transporter permease [Nitrospirota bacterium]MDH5768119.1 energy-coupling factor ABC transporter permease [Nitrospirota bacterium]